MLIDKKKITVEKKRLRKLWEKEKSGEILPGSTYMSFQSWMSNAKKGNTYNIQKEMTNFYKEIIS